MAYPYGTQGAPAVGNGLGGLPRRAAAAAATSNGRMRLEYADINFNTLGMPSPDVSASYFAGPPLIVGSTLYWNYAFNPGGTWAHYLFKATVDKNALTISNPTSTYIDSNSSPFVGTFGMNSAQVKTILVGTDQVLATVGYSHACRLYDFAARTITNYTLKTSGTYSNGGSWASLLSDNLNSCERVVLSEDGSTIYWAGIDSNYKPHIQAIDRATNTLIKATAAANALSYSQNSASILIKTAFGFISIHGSRTSGLWAGRISTWSNNIDAIAQSSEYTLSAVVGTEHPGLLGAYYDPSTGGLMMFHQENSIIGMVSAIVDSTGAISFAGGGFTMPNTVRTNQTTTYVQLTENFYNLPANSGGSNSYPIPVSRFGSCLARLEYGEVQSSGQLYLPRDVLVESSVAVGSYTAAGSANWAPTIRGIIPEVKGSTASICDFGDIAIRAQPYNGNPGYFRLFKRAYA